MGQLFFFIVATMPLCCRSMTKPVLVTNLCFSYFWAVPGQHQSFCFFFCAALCKEAGVWKRLVGGPIDQMAGLCHIIWLTVKLGGAGVFFQSTCCSETGWALVCSWEVVNDCLCIILFYFFLFIYEFIFVSAHKFSCFSPFISLPQPNAGELARDQMRA